MAGRLLATLVTAAAAGVVALPSAAAAPTVAPAGSVNDWQRGQWWVDAAKLSTWHQQGITGKGVTVALLDGPVAIGIPELQGQDVEPTATLCDRDLWRPWGPTTPDGPLDDTSFHTTSMAALIVGNGRGNGPGGVGVLGVAPGATLKTYAMFNTVDLAAHQNLDCWGPGLPGFLDRIVADGAQVIQVPVSFDVANDAIQAAVNRAVAKGVVIVAASGNGGPSAKVMSPGGNAGVLVVGGMQPDGQVLETNPTSAVDNWDQARTSDAQYNIHLVAPGADLVGGGLTPGNRWDSAVLQSGSSGASAIVTGQLALMKQRWPKATGNQLIYSLLRNARRPDGSAVWEPRRGFGTTSFEATLTTDPTTYPNVMPIFASMGNVVSDQPTAPFIPLQVGSDGRLPDPPAEATATPGGGPATAAAAPASIPVSTTSGTAWLVWLVCGVVVVAVLAVGGSALTGNRAPGTDPFLDVPVSARSPRFERMSDTSTSATSDNTEFSSVPEQHGLAEQEALPDLVEPEGVNGGSARAVAVEGGPPSSDVIGASEPGEASGTVKDPSDWVTGDEPMTGAQRSYLETLAREAGEQLPADLTKAQASEHIDRLQATTGRGQSDSG